MGIKSTRLLQFGMCLSLLIASAYGLLDISDDCALSLDKWFRQPPDTAKVQCYYMAHRGDRSGSFIRFFLNAQIYSWMYGVTVCGSVYLNEDIVNSTKPILGNWPDVNAEHVKLLDILGIHLNATSLGVSPRSLRNGTWATLPCATGTFMFTEAMLQKLRALVTYSRDIFGQNSNKHTIVVHVRRGDSSPLHPSKTQRRRYMRNLYYLAVIEQYAQSNSHVIILSQRESYESFDEFIARGYEVILDGPVTDAWQMMMNADIFIMSASGFSYVPAIYAKGSVIYAPELVFPNFQPLSTWVMADPNAWKQSRKWARLKWAQDRCLRNSSSLLCGVLRRQGSGVLRNECSRNERVSGFVCVPCPPGSFNFAGDIVSDGDSQCLELSLWTSVIGFTAAGCCALLYIRNKRPKGKTLKKQTG